MLVCEATPLCRDAQLEVKGVASAASVAKADLQGQVHSFEVLLSQERSAHSLQVSQLQQQIEALESDKNSAVKHYDDLSKSMQCASSKADASSQVSSLKQEIEAVKQVLTPWCFTCGCHILNDMYLCCQLPTSMLLSTHRSESM